MSNAAGASEPPKYDIIGPIEKARILTNLYMRRRGKSRPLALGILLMAVGIACLEYGPYDMGGLSMALGPYELALTAMDVSILIQYLFGLLAVAGLCLASSTYAQMREVKALIKKIKEV